MTASSSGSSSPRPSSSRSFSSGPPSSSSPSPSPTSSRPTSPGQSSSRQSPPQQQQRPIRTLMSDFNKLKAHAEAQCWELSVDEFREWLRCIEIIAEFHKQLRVKILDVIMRLVLRWSGRFNFVDWACGMLLLSPYKIATLGKLDVFQLRKALLRLGR